MRPLFKLLLVTALPACGTPGSDSVFTRNNPKFAPVDTPKTEVVARPVRPAIATRAYAGYYRKSGDDSQFQPCGTTQLLEITGPPMARLILRDTFRWNAIWEGARLFAVLQGAIIDDTTRADSSKTGATKRFYLVDVDSMRTWRKGDCNGMRLPKS